MVQPMVNSSPSAGEDQWPSSKTDLGEDQCPSSKTDLAEQDPCLDHHGVPSAYHSPRT